MEGPGLSKGEVRVCPRCGRQQDAARRSCEHCGLHFRLDGDTALTPLARSEVIKPPSELQRSALMVLGCIWVGFGALIVLVIVGALLGR